MVDGLIFDLSFPGKEVFVMAKDGEGRKYNRIPAHTREQNGKTVKVSERVRSNRKIRQEAMARSYERYFHQTGASYGK
jgi:hypothetical protein